MAVVIVVRSSGRLRKLIMTSSQDTHIYGGDVKDATNVSKLAVLLTTKRIGALSITFRAAMLQIGRLFLLRYRCSTQNSTTKVKKSGKFNL